MAETDIHGFKVKYDDDSQTLKKAVKYLKEKIDKSEAEVFFDAARRDMVHHNSHFEFRDHEYNTDRNLTLVYDGDGKYHIRKRSHH
jgi:hypothetical protein